MLGSYGLYLMLERWDGILFYEKLALILLLEVDEDGREGNSEVWNCFLEFGELESDGGAGWSDDLSEGILDLSINWHILY